MKTGRVVFGTLAILLVALSSAPILPQVHSISSGNIVYVDESSHIYGQNQTIIAVTVRLNLASDESISGYDVRLNYTGFPQILQAQSIDVSNNVFASLGGGYPLAECYDGTVYANTRCANDDFRSGLVHVAIALGTATVLPGPVTGGKLFSVAFKVKGNGTSIFTIDRANLLNPGTGLPPNIQYVPVITQGGIFGNKGIAAFFNYATSNPSLSPSVLPTVQVNFDAGVSFDASNFNTITGYSWNFGDGGTATRLVNPTHLYRLAGTYDVSLNASTASAYGIIHRQVVVDQMLGNLSISVRPNSGSLPTKVFVQLYNDSAQTIPAASGYTNLGNITFANLIPGSYSAKFSAAGVVSATRSESVTPGWTTLDAVYLDLVPTPPDYSAFIFVGGLVAAIAVFLGFALFKWRKTHRARLAETKRLRKR